MVFFPIVLGPRNLENRAANFLDKNTEVLSCEAQLPLTNLGFLESKAAAHNSAPAVRTMSLAGKVLATNAPNLVISIR